jgi:hypothetical protein
MLVAELAQAHHQFRGCHIKSAFALNWFDDDGGNARRFNIAFEQHLNGMNGIFNTDALVLDRERHMPYACGHWPKPGLVG